MNRSKRFRFSLGLAAAGLAALVYAAIKPRSAYHPVTATMDAAARAVAGGRAPALEAEGTDGVLHAPASDSRERPLVLFFIQDGCPCSEAAEPYFRRVGLAYAGSASFLGVIDGDLETARGWSVTHGTPYPLLADPERALITACKAERSAYVMLVRPGGRIDALWPGYSSEMLAELRSRLEHLTGRTQAAIDLRGAPAELASGCSF